MPVPGSLCKDGVACLGVGAEPGQPPDMSQHHESEASGKGHVHLGCVTRFKVPQSRSRDSCFLFCAARTKAECTGRSGHPPKQGPCSRETYLLHETGFLRLAEINRSGNSGEDSGKGGGGGRREEDLTGPDL